MAHGDIKPRSLSETKSSSSPASMLAAAIAPPVAFTLYLVAMFSLLWWHRRRQLRMRPPGDLDGNISEGDVESKHQQQSQHRPSMLAFASSILEVPLSPAVDSSTPLAPRTRGYSGVLAISPVTPTFSPTSTSTGVGSPLNPQRLPLPSNPSPRPSATRNSRFRIGVPAFVGRRLSSSPNGNNSSNATASGSRGVTGDGIGGWGGSEGGGGGVGGGGSGYRHGRRRSRADPVLPRTPTPAAAASTPRFNSNDMLARRPRVPSIRQHILNSHNHGALLASGSSTTTSPPPLNSPLPLTATLSPSSPMPTMPALCMLPRPRFSTSSSRSKDNKTRVRPLPPLPLHELSPPATTLSPQSATTASPLLAQPIVLQPNRLHLSEKEQQPAPHSACSLSRPYPFSRLVGQRRQRARDPDSPPPYTSQYLDKP